MTIVKKSGSGQAYRHTPAFILLFLARENSYGSQLLKTMQSELPCYHTDSAIIYRSLQELEKAGKVESYWETDTSGPARKWYKMTEAGWEELAKLKADIEMRKANFDYFLDTYKKINKG